MLEDEDWKVDIISNQDEKWSGEFGDRYTKRNFRYVDGLNKDYVEKYGIGRYDINREFLTDDIIDINSKILEVGCNIGTQLVCLKMMGFKNLYGIDINEHSLNVGRSRDNSLHLIKGNVLNIPFKDDFFDMVITNGLLIHIDPDRMSQAVNEICRVSKEYIYGLEYYSEEIEQIQYRDNMDLCWKGNYPEFFNKYYFKRMRTEKTKILSYLDGSGNRDIVFLIKILGGGD